MRKGRGSIFSRSYCRVENLEGDWSHQGRPLGKGQARGWREAGKIEGRHQKLGIIRLGTLVRKALRGVAGTTTKTNHRSIS